MNYQFKTVVVAGTFDRLHLGHQKLLHKALHCSQNIVCGLTTPQMNQKKILSQTIESFGKRQESIKDFFNNYQASQRTRIVPLTDQFGPTLQETPIQAIIASLETEKNVDLINQIRKQKKLPPLTKIILEKIQAQDQKELSSTRIRLGEISRQGKVWQQFFQNKSFILPARQRKYFQKPLGKLLKGNINNSRWLTILAKQEIAKHFTPLVITVGDIITHSFWQNKNNFSLGVIDYKSLRRPLAVSFHEPLLKIITDCQKVENQPGTISSQTIAKVGQLLTDLVMQKKQAILQVDGEEDLTVLPLTLLAPLESLIFYGQPNKGIVKIQVTEKIKEKVHQLLKKFKNV